MSLWGELQTLRCLCGLEQKQVTPPFKPQITDEYGLDNFDTQFTNEPVQLTPDDDDSYECCCWQSVSDCVLLWSSLTRHGASSHRGTPNCSRSGAYKSQEVVKTKAECCDGDGPDSRIPAQFPFIRTRERSDGNAAGHCGSPSPKAPATALGSDLRQQRKVCSTRNFRGT
ncbi:hypothetical protein P4O66_022700 [Electrophorus voltai]|uniref:AGC-kinase C-terminal domain-containing protein n=1 Tax=Electrophorus voltai TaxID=2609070 RepID=A0AAD9E160_9TELE|nr:hypothetical protein P4O66_022700 [Electrophorus voltai]